MDSIDVVGAEGAENGTNDAGQDYKDLYLRTLADFDNYRKRIERERDEIGAAGKRDVLLGVVDVVDNFERAANAADDSEVDDAFATGIQAIFRQLRRLLLAHGVEPFVSVGKPFDPERHEAVALVPSDDVPEDTVVGEGRPGYTWNGKLLRPARVFVSTGPSAA